MDHEAAGVQERMVFIEQRRSEDGGAADVPDGCVPLRYASSVSGQIAAVRRALADAPEGGEGQWHC